MFKKILIALFIALFAIQIQAQCMENTIILAQTEEVVEQNIEDTTNYADEESITTTPMAGEIDSKVAKSPYENNFQEKTPEQNEFTKAVFMFLKTMFAVAICSIIIFLLLLVVRKFYGTGEQKIASDAKIEDNLKSTKNENEALQIFFNKTKNL